MSSLQATPFNRGVWQAMNTILGTHQSGDTHPGISSLSPQAMPPSVRIYPQFYGNTRAFTDEKC